MVNVNHTPPMLNIYLPNRVDRFSDNRTYIKVSSRHLDTILENTFHLTNAYATSPVHFHRLSYSISTLKNFLKQTKNYCSQRLFFWQWKFTKLFCLDVAQGHMKGAPNETFLLAMILGRNQLRRIKKIQNTKEIFLFVLSRVRRN